MPAPGGYGVPQSPSGFELYADEALQAPHCGEDMEVDSNGSGNEPAANAGGAVEIEYAEEEPEDVPEDEVEDEAEDEAEKGGSEVWHDESEQVLRIAEQDSLAQEDRDALGGVGSSHHGDRWEQDWMTDLRQNRLGAHGNSNKGSNHAANAMGHPRRSVVSRPGRDGLDSHVGATSAHDGSFISEECDSIGIGGDQSDDGGNDDARGTLGNVPVDARCMGDFDDSHHGFSIKPIIPEFRHGTSANSTWMSYSDARNEVQNMCPVRTLCWNIPVKIFARDGSRFRHWSTPQKNTTRASNIASVVSFCMTGTSKGFLSGQHEELHRANGEAEEDSEHGAEDKDKRKKLSRVHRYAFVLPNDNNVTMPMFTFAYEELYDQTLTNVTCIRVWKFVFDKTHSDSELARKLLDENRDTFANAGVAHAPNASRRKMLVMEQKQNRQQMGGIKGGSALEYYAGMQYAGINNEELWYRRLVSYGGKNMHNEGRPFWDDKRLPAGVNNKRITPDPFLGGTHPYSPEYVFNARRHAAFRAGTCDIEDNMPCDIHPDFLDTTKYWTDDHKFVLPDVSAKNNGFFFLVNPYVTNIFDVALPRPIYGNASAGPHILRLYGECFFEKVQAAGGTRASVSDCFNSMMTQQDPATLDMEKQMSETIISYDSIDATELERKGLRHYGDVDSSSSFIIEPRQILKQFQLETRRVISELIQPWVKEREELVADENASIKMGMMQKSADSDDMLEVDYQDDAMASVRELEDATTKRHCEVMKDLICLHLRRIEEAFQSKLERETIPQGYIAMFDGLQAELAKMPNQTASVAFVHNMSLQFSDISSYAHINLWLGEFFEKDCFIEGRDRRIMDEIFLHLFEQYGDVTFLLLLCGHKGNGKTLRTERAMAVFPPNWITMGGPASARAGMNGQSDSTNGKNVVYDEMVDELCEADGSDRLEFWKQIVLKREYTYNRTVQIKNPDGSETHKTMKLRTPHDETHMICTNYGMAFTKNGDPSDTKFAMIDRSIAHVVRSVGKKARTDTEFYEHLSKPEQQSKLAVFRIFVCLVGATKLAIKGVPVFQPNLALANKLFDYLDNTMIVGEYNLPRRSARKSLKREENLKTMTIMKAVADVFLYKQSALQFEAGKLGPDGKPQPFKFCMLYDVIRQLRATPELIFMAWSQSLDYNIGTSSHSFAAMTALCNTFGFTVGDWFKRPPTPDLDDMRRASVGTPSGGFVPAGTQTANQRAQADATANQQISVKAKESMEAQLPQMLDIHGMPRNDRLEILKGFERQRRATSLYRHTCSEEGNSDLVMDDPVNVIEKVMQKHGNPADIEDAETAGPSEGGAECCLPVYSSSIMATVVQTCCVYNPLAVAHWCADRSTGKEHCGIKELGTADGLMFSERNTTGACKWNTAWVRQNGGDGWKGFANSIINSNPICKMFDLSSNGLRDLFFLLSTRDNARRCTEEPRVPYSKEKRLAFQDDAGHAVGDLSLSIKMRGLVDSRFSHDLRPGTNELMRHPYAKVVDVEVQRCVDLMSRSGRLPAVMPMISNNVRDAPPVRLVAVDDKKYIELNMSAAIEHTKMLAEASFRCSMQPGMENIQEAFTDGSTGPSGLQIDKSESSSSDHTTMFPFSYDMLSISFALDAMERYYDPDMNSYLAMYKDAFGDTLNFNPTKDDLPHMCMRFVGLADMKSRALLSVPLKAKQSQAFKSVEVSDDAEATEDEFTTFKHLQLSLGHEPSDEEIERYVKSRAGSRAMSGVTGDLLSMTTYFQHTLTTLKERGMVMGEDDVVAHVVADDPYGLRMRVAEIAGRKINDIVANHPDIIAATQELPKGHEDMPQERIKQFRETRIHQVRTKLYSDIELPDHLDMLREYAPLNVSALSKMTFHNNEKERMRYEETNQKKKRKYTVVDSSSQFKDQSLFKQKTLPGLGGSLKARGKQDSRTKRGGISA